MTVVDLSASGPGPNTSGSRGGDGSQARLTINTLVNTSVNPPASTSLAVTDRYLRDVAPTHVIDTMRARQWDST